MMNDASLTACLPEMLTGDELRNRIEYFPPYDKDIRLKSSAERLAALNGLYDLYLPSNLSTEIYSKMYLAVMRSLQKKCGKLDIMQKNLNDTGIRKNIINGGIMGGSDSFTIIGNSGIGKSTAIAKAADLIMECGIIETKEPFNKIIPVISVQCPFDCSVKGLLLQILRQTDELINSHYYEMAVKARATTDMLIGSVSQAALNHIGLLVVDEIQNIVKHRNGNQLVSCLTQLINNSGISICMVGTPEAEIFFEKVDYLARRALGLRYGKQEYDNHFIDFCSALFSYQYVKNRTQITERIVDWLYEHSGGILSHVVSLLHDAQEISILNKYETLDIPSLKEAYRQRMSMVHSHTQETVIMVRPQSKTGKGSRIAAKNIKKSYADLNGQDDFSMIKLAEKAKREGTDMMSLLKGKIPITEVSVC